MSSAGIIQVEPQRLRTAAAQISQLSGEYDILYTGVLSKISEIRVEYQGADSQAFLERVEGFRIEFVKMKAEIDRYSEFLIQAAKEHEEAQRVALENAKKLVTGGSR
jgi:uncharacterized protein YukE